MSGHPIFKIHEALKVADLEYSAYSCNGVDLVGDKKSIDAAMSAFHAKAQMPDFVRDLRHWREECGKLHAKVATERERIAQMVERADNTMMKQDRLAEHIRKSAP